MSFKPTYYTSLILVFSLLFVISCSTEKEALLNKGYHNMTARYNGYYNAGVIIDDALQSYRNDYQENYEIIIPLDLYPGVEDASGLFPDMDDAIERCEKVIVRHSMPNPQRVKNKSEEHCRWIDDNWLVIGQAHYIKREYDAAKEKLNYVSESFNGEESVYEARIWLAKTHIALGEYSEAKIILISVKQSIDRTEEEKNNKDKDNKKKRSKLDRKRGKKKTKEKDNSPAPFPKKLEVDYEVAMAELYIAQDENKKAIEHLENAVSQCRNRKRRARYMFALAQLYSEQGNDGQASIYYNKVAHSNAPYEMQFKAKIRKALTSTGNSEELVKELNKMLKDGKNLEYKDQIYYALAELDMKNSNKDEAKKNYTRSVKWSISNNLQKGTSYLRLADIHFEDKDYLKAQKYYDSCVQALPKDYEGYEQLQNKAEGLSDLVFHYERVEFEDSVQRIVGMSEKEREKFLEKTLKQIKAEEERKKQEAAQRLVDQQKRINNQAATGGTGNKWYFYNSKQIASGFNDFRGLWGQRALEDNWRRSNKSSTTAFLGDDGEPVDSVQTDSLTVDVLRANLPLTPAEIDSSNNRIIESLYNLGIIYKEQLKEEPEAISYFNAVVERKIEHPKVLPSLYQLYLIYNRKSDPKAGTYKSAIIKNYPKSEIAQILLDPDYLKKKELKDKEELTAYSNTLRSYRQRRYGVVISKCNEIILNNPENKYLNKYYLLKAFAVSKINAGNIEAISDPLRTVYERAPESEEGKQAKIYLDKLKAGEDITEPDDNAGIPEDTPYIFDEKSKHFFIVSIPNETGNVSETKIKMSNFNNEFFRKDKLSLRDAPLGEKHQVLIVRTFEDLEKAKVYMTTFGSDSATELLGTTAKDFDICLISTKNFGELFKNKDIDSYLEFYQAAYN